MLIVLFGSRLKPRLICHISLICNSNANALSINVISIVQLLVCLENKSIHDAESPKVSHVVPVPYEEPIMIDSHMTDDPIYVFDVARLPGLRIVNHHLSLTCVLYGCKKILPMHRLNG